MNPPWPLRVALVAPPWFAVPPEGYGGIEQVVYLLARELKARGHEVTIFARQGSSPDLEVVPLAPQSWTEQLGSRDAMARECLHVYRAYELIRRHPFDVVHDHTGFVGMMLGAALRLPAPIVSTVHGDLTEADAEFLGTLAQRVALVAITTSQRNQVASVDWTGVVHNAVDGDQFELAAEKDGYLLQLARITPDKGQHLAIEVARRVGLPLVLAGKVDADSRDYFREQIEPNLDGDIRWIEDAQGKEKAQLLARARAMLFPIQWEEPFGLAMIEAMASGTPVVATRRGAASELVEEGLTGFLADEPEELAEAVQRTGEIDPRRCAEHARERFSASHMAEGYEDVYRAAIQRQGQLPG